MSRQSPWVPNATPMIFGGVAFDFEPERLEAIQAAFGKELDKSSIDELAEICSNYVALRHVELERPLLSDVLAQVDAIGQAAKALQLALEILQHEDGTAPRVVRVVGYALREVHDEDVRAGIKNRPIFLDEMQIQAYGLARAADKARLKFTNPRLSRSEIQTTAPEDAGLYLIAALVEFAEIRGVSASARGDYESISPFVEFVIKVNAALGEQYQRKYESDQGFSRWISEAKRKTIRVKFKAP